MVDEEGFEKQRGTTLTELQLPALSKVSWLMSLLHLISASFFLLLLLSPTYISFQHVSHSITLSHPHSGT